MGNGYQKAGKVVGGGAPVAAAPTSPPSTTSDTGQELIRHFEGCELTAYRCSAGQITIGFGHCGPDVYEGQKITQAVANQLLRDDLDKFERAVIESIDVPLDQSEFDALVSFSFNCGVGAFQDSTLRKRLNRGETKATVFAEELPRWTNGGLAGLVRRRDAEVKLANQKQFP